MREFESIRNAARMLNQYIKNDYTTFLSKKDSGQIPKNRVAEIEKTFDRKFMELQQITNAVNKLRPFETAANRHLDNQGNNNCLAYRQAFDKEDLRQEYLTKYARP